MSHLPVIRVIPKHTGDLSVTNVVPPELTACKIPCAENQIILAGSSGHFFLQEIKVSQHSIWYNNFLIEQDESFRLVADGPVFVFLLILRNSFFIEGDPPFVFHEGRYNLVYLPSIDHEIRLKKGRLYTSVIIHFPVDNLLSMARYYTTLDEFIRTAGQDQPVLLRPAPPMITVKMKHNIENILYCNYNAGIKNAFLDGQLLSILIEVMEQASHHPLAHAVNLTEQETDGIYTVRDELTNHLEKGINVKTLAKKAGMNVSQLKHLFKVFFGVSISEYHITARMKRAVELLTGTNKNVNEIADLVGYASDKTFIREFAKHHKGVTPDKFRKMYADQQPGE